MAGITKGTSTKRLANLRSRAVTVFDGDRRAAALWLRTPQVGLGGAEPRQHARTAKGAREVAQLLTRIDQGVYA
jgi:putative toxin-antitoxin system antitoxin component (TIGR02293 family)